MPTTSCFSYPADPPQSGINRGAVQPNLAGLRRMPATCFSYSAAAPPGIWNRNTEQPGPDDHSSPPGRNSGFVSSACMSYPVFACFRYWLDEFS
jgi:hypothetical protein